MEQDTQEQKSVCGILLVNTGTVDSPRPRAARKFLRKYLMSERIAPMNRFIWWFIVNLKIVPSRARQSAEKYQKIWTEEGSPLAIAHQKIELGLAKQYEAQGFSNVVVRCAMSYSEPDIKSTMKELKELGCDRLIVLPLYPQSAYATTGDVYDKTQELLKHLKWDIPCRLIDNYHDNPIYAKAIAASIKHQGFQAEESDKLLFSFHSIPLRDVEAGDTYELQVGASSLLIANNLDLAREQWTIGYQSRFADQSAWLAPFTEEVLERWAKAGVQRLFLVCPGFSVDCLETLYDVEYELKPYYRRWIEYHNHDFEPEFIYVPCLDKTKAHVTVLYDVLLPHVEEYQYG